MSADSLALGVVGWLATFAVHSTILLGSAWLFGSRLSGGAHRDEERWWKVAVTGRGSRGFADAVPLLEHARRREPERRDHDDEREPIEWGHRLDDLSPPSNGCGATAQGEGNVRTERRSDLGADFGDAVGANFGQVVNLADQIGFGRNL